MPLVPAALPSVGLVPRSWRLPRRPRKPWHGLSIGLLRGMAFPAAPGSYRLTRSVPWPGKPRRGKSHRPGHARRRGDLQHLGTEQRRVIGHPLRITESVESRLESRHDCLRITRRCREETRQVGEAELGPLAITPFVRAVGVEQEGIACHKLPLFLAIGERLLNAERNIRRCTQTLDLSVSMTEQKRGMPGADELDVASDDIQHDILHRDERAEAQIALTEQTVEHLHDALGISTMAGTGTKFTHEPGHLQGGRDAFPRHITEEKTNSVRLQAYGIV